LDQPGAPGYTPPAGQPAGGSIVQTLREKRVLITGGASGIGRTLAERVARDGAELVLVDVNGPLLAETAAALRARGATVQSHECDLTDPSRVQGLREAVLREGGPIDVLVNNAGVVFGGAFLDVPVERHLTTYRVNTIALVTMTHAFLPDLLGRPEAHVVNVASASGYIGLPFGATYASSKWAVIGFSESLALELDLQGRSNVHVTTVCPSYVTTGLFDGARAPFMTRLLTPARVAELTVRGILKNKPVVRMPWLVAMTPPMKGLLPFRTFARVAAWLGVNTSMMQWKGRPPT
jgi:all-trans-retinol dehydrogenase (NAD+)